MASADPSFDRKTKFWYIPKPQGYTFFEKDSEKGNILLISNTESFPVKRGGLYRKNFIPVEAGKTYTFEADFKGELSEGYASILLSIFGEKKGKQAYLKSFESSRISHTRGEWVRISMTFTIPEGGKKSTLRTFCKKFLRKSHVR
ncbi:MAG: carbohydrate binding domain-containing protein [Lentisphaeria bacterium]|nr:carbohydrate binding domain-containing protein [Lentisphaeria bacterium]